jgi:hypothetical protein
MVVGRRAEVVRFGRDLGSIDGNARCKRERKLGWVSVRAPGARCHVIGQRWSGRYLLLWRLCASKKPINLFLDGLDVIWLTVAENELCRCRLPLSTGVVVIASLCIFVRATRRKTPTQHTLVQFELENTQHGTQSKREAALL